MNPALVFPFLTAVAENNNREWFAQHKDDYNLALAEVQALVAQAIAVISTFDKTIAHLTPKDCLYRFYRDTRFSPDKAPYKRHFGAYICCKGKSSFYGGYYIHLQPNNSFLATGSYCLPQHILTACRNEIMANIATWRRCVESRRFITCYGRASEENALDTYTSAVPLRGFGSTAFLRRCPTGFPTDYEYAIYLRMKDYCCWRRVDDTFFSTDTWPDEMKHLFRTAKPMNDFINAVIADYE